MLENRECHLQKWKRKKIHFFNGSDISRNTSFDGECYIYGKVLDSHLEGGNAIYGNLDSCDMGYGSFVAPYSTLSFTKVGRFTSIGRYVDIVRGQHPITGFVSTAPCFYSLGKQSGFTFVKEQLYNDYKMLDENYAVKIGSDVWIGSHVTILEGVEIGDGAIIAAGAVVTKDVEPYTVVGGVPAKKIKERFAKEQINELLKYKWWNKSIDWIQNNCDKFSNIEDFVVHINDSKDNQ